MQTHSLDADFKMYPVLLPSHVIGGKTGRFSVLWASDAGTQRCFELIPIVFTHWQNYRAPGLIDV